LSGFQGEWKARTIEIGKNIQLGKIVVDLSKLPAPGQYTLIVTVGPAEAFGPIDKKIIPGPGIVRGETYFENQWNFWVYPPAGMDETAVVSDATNQSSRAQDHHKSATPAQECPPSAIQDLLITNSLAEAEARLVSGGRVLFSPRTSDLDWTSSPLDIVPVFWNRQMGPGWGRMLGLWIDRKRGESRAHTLDGFPTNEYFDWQWAEIVRGVRAINMDRLPAEVEAVVWAIDDWNRNYKLGVVFECVVGQGRLLVSAIDVTKPNSPNPVLQQFRNAVIKYARSDCFQPTTAVSREALRSLFFDTRVMTKLQAKATVGGQPAGMVIDGDPNTFLLVGDQKSSAREQVDIVIEFPALVPMSGLVLMPRQNHREHEGDTKDYVIEVSDDGNVWSGIARGELRSTFGPQTIDFTRTITTRYLKLVSLNGFGPDKTTSLAELAVIYAGSKLNDGAGPIEYQRNRSATPDIDEGPGPKPTPSKPKP
jgi:beta-galactosidase